MGSRGGCSHGRHFLVGRFLVEFQGDILARDEQAPAVNANVGAGPGAIASTRKIVSADGKTCRVLFDLDPGSEPLCEMRVYLEAGGKRLSEIWLYRWTP